MTVWQWLLPLAGLVLASQIAWRWMSRKWTLPCPTALAWLLESRVSDWIAGTTRTIERMEIQPGWTVVEIGPGPGRLLIPVAQRIGPQGRMIGVDIQEGMLRRTQAKVDRLGLANVQLIHGDATQKHVDDDSADLVYLCTVLGEIPNREEALRRCWEMLKPGGVLAITEIALDPHFQSQSVVKRLAQGAGFAFLDCAGRPWSYTARYRKRPE
jgi:ubiquinone/menaquinone biosynthesis C-methylase UbiE